MTIRLRLVQPPMLIGWKSSGYAGLPPARPAETAARVLDCGPPSPLLLPGWPAAGGADLLSVPSGCSVLFRSSSIMSESFRTGGGLVAMPRQPSHSRTTLSNSSRDLGPQFGRPSPGNQRRGTPRGEVKVINQGGKTSGRGLRPEPRPHGHLGCGAVVTEPGSTGPG